MAVGYLLGAIVVLHIVIIAAQEFLGPLNTSAAVLSEEALRARDIALHGQGDEDDTVLEIADEVHTHGPWHASILFLHSLHTCQMMHTADTSGQETVCLVPSQRSVGILVSIHCSPGCHLSSVMHAALL